MPSDRVAVVGADGTLGSHLAKVLDARGFSRSDFVLREPSEALSGYQVIINASGPRVRPGLRWGDYLREHVGMATSVGRSAKPGDLIIHLSSASVYGSRRVRIKSNAPESPETFPNPSYASAKLASETALLAATPAACQVVTLRLAMVYGSGISSALDSLRRLCKPLVGLALSPSETPHQYLRMVLLVDALRAAMDKPPRTRRPMILADPFALLGSEINALLPHSRLSIPLPTRFAQSVVDRWNDATAIEPPGNLASLAVLAAGNTYDVEETFAALCLDEKRYSREDGLAELSGVPS